MGDFARRPGAMLSMVIQKPGENAAAGSAGNDAAQAASNQLAQLPAQPQPGYAPRGAGPAVVGRARGQNPAGLVGPVQIEMLDGLDVLVIRGNPRDVEQITQILQQIEQLSTQTEPAIELYQVQHVDGESLAFLVNQLYSQVFSARQGNVTITALIKPNVLLLVGRAENVHTALDLIKRLDQPVSPETQFQVFPLKHASALTAQDTVQNFFTSRGGLSTRARVTADFRTNALVVQASPGDVTDVAALINKLDAPTSDAVNELRVFGLEHSLATDVYNTLQYAIGAQMPGGARPGMPGGLGGAAGGAGGMAAMMGKSSMLRFVTVDTKGQKILSSGILTDVRITPDTRSNSILVSAPADSMDLIGALIQELDQRPAATAAIKVFTIVNADVGDMVNMLNAVFGQSAGMQPGIAQAGVGGEGESSIIPVRFAFDVRTNSIIASGSQGDLAIVEAILLRLDEADARQRKTTVYRLKNSFAPDVANAINNLLQNERQLQVQSGIVSATEQLAHFAVVVAEPDTNSLIVSATPQFYEEIEALVNKLDLRPPMVMIQVLVAQVNLTDFNEFGIELGLQDSLLFDRSVLNSINTLTNTATTVTNSASGAVASTVTAQNQQVIGGTLAPGYGFNNQPIGNSAAGANSLGIPNSLGTAGNVAGQGLSNFGVGRTNSTLGYGGLVLSASSDSVSALLRALQQDERLEVLSRPQIMTLDNQAAYVQVGQRVPRVNSSSITTAGNQINTITLENVGLILGVTPRISPDGLVVMELDAEKSALEPLSSGIPISVLTNGQVITSPIIDITTAQTTVSAADGQTLIFAGLISTEKDVIKRRVPYLSDIPILGNLFRYDSTTKNRSELLIIMTPHIVKTDEDMDRVKRLEASRMSWCLADAEAMHGNLGVRGRNDHWHDTETAVVYPDVEPGAPKPAGDGTPTPAPMPGSVEMIPTPPAAPQAERKPQSIHVEDKVPSLTPAQSPAGQKSSQLDTIPQSSQQTWQEQAPMAGPGWQTTPPTQPYAPPPPGSAAANYAAQPPQPQGYGSGVVPAAYGAPASASPGWDGNVRPAAYGTPQSP
jgi:type II secretion system protein D